MGLIRQRRKKAWVWEGTYKGGKATTFFSVCVLNFIYVHTWYVCIGCVCVLWWTSSGIGSLHLNVDSKDPTQVSKFALQESLPREPSCQPPFWILLCLRQGLMYPRLTSWSSCLHFLSAEIKGNCAWLPFYVCSFQIWAQARGYMSVGSAPVSVSKNLLPFNSMTDSRLCQSPPPKKKC